MSRLLDLRRFCCAVGCVAVSGIAAGARQPAATLNLLTVPSTNLSSACELKQPEPEHAAIPAAETSTAGGTTMVVNTRRRGPIPFPSPFPSNPWSGADYKFKLIVRKALDGSGPLRVPDAPPLSPRELAALESSWADNVVDVYRATYVAADGDRVEVSAVRFDDARLATGEPSRETLGASHGTRIVHGATAILVSGAKGSACFDAVSRHIQSLRGLS